MIDLPSLTALLEDDALVRKYLERFAQDMPALLQQIQTAVANAQWDELQLHAHTFKSQLQYINATPVIPIAAALEQIHIEPMPDRSTLDAMIGKLKHHLQEILEEINRINA